MYKRTPSIRRVAGQTVRRASACGGQRRKRSAMTGMDTGRRRRSRGRAPSRREQHRKPSAQTRSSSQGLEVNAKRLLGFQGVRGTSKLL